MKRLSKIDLLGQERPPLSAQEREKLRQARIQQAKEAGYQQLVELCALGEYDAARHLANRNPAWGYQVIEGEVTEKIEDS